MALLIHPNGKQEFLTLPDAKADKVKLLTQKFSGDEAKPTAEKISDDSIAKRLKFCQIVIQRMGTGCPINSPGLRFCGLKQEQVCYKGVMAFLRADEII